MNVHPDEAFTAALLADLGMLILAQVDPDNYVPMVADAESSDQLVEREVARYGFDHAAVTGRVARPLAVARRNRRGGVASP